jgi:hypothetical protein
MGQSVLNPYAFTELEGDELGIKSMADEIRSANG